MADRHYDDEALISFLESEGAAAQDAHLAACGDCRETLATLQSIATAMHDESVWQPPADSTPNPQTIATLRAFAEEMEREDREAEAWVTELTAAPRATWTAQVAQHPERRTAGMVRRLLAAADRAIDTMPPDAVALTALATTIADGLMPSRYESDAVAKLRGAAWRDHAYALYYTGSFADAEKAVLASERHFSDCSVGEYELARVAVVRALVYRSQERLVDGSPVASRAATSFRSFGDAQRASSAESVYASMLFSQHQFAAALDVWRRLIDLPSDDAVAYARNLSNIATCERHLGANDSAIRNYATAASLFRDIGSETNALRVEWSIASTLAATGRVADALRELNELKAQFDSLGMISESALVALDVAELLLGVGRMAEIPALCASAIESFRRSGIPYGTNAQTAMAFLRESSAEGRVTPFEIRRVRSYLRHLPDQPQLVFASAPE